MVIFVVYKKNGLILSVFFGSFMSVLGKFVKK